MKTVNFLKSPLTINWALSNRCNFHCRHCYSRTDPSEELDVETLFSCIEKICAAGVLSINFGGGEPLLRKDLLEIASFSSEKVLSSATRNVHEDVASTARQTTPRARWIMSG